MRGVVHDCSPKDFLHVALYLHPPVCWTSHIITACVITFILEMFYFCHLSYGCKKKKKCTKSSSFIYHNLKLQEGNMPVTRN